MDTQDIVEAWRQKAIQEGKGKACADDVLTVFRVRGIAVSETARKCILAEKDLQQLERWLERPALPHHSERSSTIDHEHLGPRGDLTGT